MIHSVIYGNLGRDAEMKQGKGANDKPFAVFSLGCSTGKDKTTWVDVTADEFLAKSIMPCLKKGQSLIIPCDLELREYNKQDGSNGVSLSARATGRIRLAGSREKREEGAAPTVTAPAPKDDFADESSVPF